MLVFKKIVAAIFMILSVVAIICLIIALFGSWSVKADLETKTVALLLAGENVIATTREGLDRVDEILINSTGVVDSIDSKVQEIGEGILEREPLVNQLLGSVNSDLVTGIENAVNSFQQIEANIIAINDAVDAIVDIPMLGIGSRMTSVTKLQEVEQQMARLREDVTGLVNTIQVGRAEIIDGQVSKVVDKTSSIRSNLHTTRANLSDAEIRLAESAQTMSDLRQRLPGLLTTITILLNIFFLLSILAFISLFLNAWEYFKCPEDGVRGLLPGDCENIPTAA